MILRTVEQAAKAKTVGRVIVATDDRRIFDVVTDAGADVVMTSESHQSGSDRIAEVARNLEPGTIIVNVQGDEPMIPPSTIDSAVTALINDTACSISTTSEQITEPRDVLSPDVVKVVTDADGRALYFSRSPIPFLREAARRHGSLENALRNEPELVGGFRKHTGLYVYRREFLLEFTGVGQTFLETSEMLEQLRALESGARIKVVEVSESSVGIDTPEDFARAAALFGDKI